MATDTIKGNEIPNCEYIKKSEKDRYKYKMETVNKFITMFAITLGVVIGMVMTSGYKYSVFIVPIGLLVIFSISDRLIKWNSDRYFKKIDEL